MYHGCLAEYVWTYPHTISILRLAVYKQLHFVLKHQVKLFEIYGHSCSVNEAITNVLDRH